MGLKEFWQGWHEEEGRRDASAIKKLQKSGVYERSDFESVRDEVERQFRIDRMSKATSRRPDIVESYSKRDLGIRSSAEIYQSFDHQTNHDDINKAINKLNTEQSQKESRAKEIISNFAGASYFGYLKLRKWLDMPLEHPKLRPWYARYLPQIPLLINPGGEIHLSEGAYVITGQISPKSHTALHGTGDATILKPGDSHGAGFKLIKNADPTGGNEYITIRDLCIDGNGLNQSYYLWMINFVNVSNGLVENCLFKNLRTVHHASQAERSQCIITSDVSSGQSNKILINQNRFYDATHISTQDHGYSTYIDSDYSIVTNNIAKDMPSEMQIVGDYAVVCGNILINNGKNSLEAHGGIIAQYSDHSIIANNILNGIGESAFFLYDSEYCIVNDNSIYNPNTDSHDELDVFVLRGGANYNLYSNNEVVKGTGIPVYTVKIDSGNNYNLFIDNDFQQGEGSSGFVSNAGTGNIFRNNQGYNPVGISSISVGASEFTHTAGSSPETIYIHSGTVSLIKKGTTTIFTDTGHSVELEPHELCKVTYSSIPTMYKDIH